MGKDRKEYMKAYRAANKEKTKAYYEENKDKIKARRKVRDFENKNLIKQQKINWRRENLEDVKAQQKALRESKGVGVYKVYFDCGVYIGSGQLYKRECDHMTGNSEISKKLGVKPITFEVVSLHGTRDEAYKAEQELIDEIGLNNILNVRNVFNIGDKDDG